MKTASRQHYRTLPIFGSFIDDFATWLRHRGLSSSKVQQHLADLQRLAPWLLRRQKRPDDLSVDDINDAERCYRLRVPSLAAVMVVLGEFLQASGRLKSRQPLRQVKPRDYGHYRQLPVFGAVVDDFAQWSLSRWVCSQIGQPSTGYLAATGAVVSTEEQAIRGGLHD